MEAIGLMPSHSGKPGGKRTGQQMTHYILDGGSYDTLGNRSPRPASRSIIKTAIRCGQLIQI